MTEIGTAHITQLLTTFDSFMKVLEDTEWIRTAKVEDIKTAFKLGSFIEKTIHSFKSKDTLEGFLSVLKNWWRTKDRTKIYNDTLYTVACDELLIQFFRCSNISQNNIDIAVRVYTSLFPKKRFEEVLTRLILDAGNLDAVTDYLKISITNSDAKCLEYQLKLQYWNNLKQKRGKICLDEEIKDMLTPYNVENFLYILIGILSISDTSDNEKTVQNIILNNIAEKMLDRSILTKQFWFTLFNKIDKLCICAACNNFEIFLKHFLNFIIYTGSMMRKVGHFWKTDTNICFYPEIQYEDILCHIGNVCKINTMKYTVINRIKEAKESTGTDIWNQILNDLGDI